jgi:predicted 3-demethylubiquinone-9 3-methyltransferase (glyoxalase superfamily)
MNHPLFTCLWFNENAQEAAAYYCSIFKDSKIVSSNTIATSFELNGTTFLALNGKQDFDFNESMSLVINCDTQDEIDHYWNAFTTEGEESMWCLLYYPVSWAIQ